jgi:hypothetical protein
MDVKRGASDGIAKEANDTVAVAQGRSTLTNRPEPPSRLDDHDDGGMRGETAA